MPNIDCSIHGRLVIVIASIFLLSSCSQRTDRPLTPQQKQFQSQIELTCSTSGQIYEKSTRNLNDPEQNRETLTFSLDSLSIKNDTCMIFNELRYALEKVYDDPRLEEIFSIEEMNDTIIARVKPENAKSSDLQLQKVLHDQNQQIRYIETMLVQDSWLYKTNIRMYVYFDSLGNYRKHMIDSKMNVSTISEAFYARIEGKLIKEGNLIKND